MFKCVRVRHWTKISYETYANDNQILQMSRLVTVDTFSVVTVSERFSGSIKI